MPIQKSHAIPLTVFWFSPTNLMLLYQIIRSVRPTNQNLKEQVILNYKVA